MQWSLNSQVWYALIHDHNEYLCLAVQVNIGPYKESNIKAYGPGLEGGIANKPADFVVETHGETGALGFAIEGELIFHC